MHAMMDSPHPLATWIDRHSTLDDFAQKIRCSPSHVRNIIARRKRPSIDLLHRIVQSTKGRVNLAAFTTDAVR